MKIWEIAVDKYRIGPHSLTSRSYVLGTLPDFFFGGGEYSQLMSKPFRIEEEYEQSKTTVFSTSCNIYISCLCYDVSVRLSVCLSVTVVHWCIIVDLGFKFRSQFAMHCGRSACGREH